MKIKQRWIVFCPSILALLFASLWGYEKFGFSKSSQLGHLEEVSGERGVAQSDSDRCLLRELDNSCLYGIKVSSIGHFRCAYFYKENNTYTIPMKESLQCVLSEED